MAWTAPKTWATSEIVTAAMMNTHVRDNLLYLKGQAGTVAIESGMTVAGSVIATVGGNNQGILSALSGNSGVLAGIGVGRTANEIQMAIVASAAQFFAGSAAGDMVLRDIDSTKKTMIGSGTTAIMTLAPGPLSGIGTTAPSGPLHIIGPAAGGAIFFDSITVAGTAVQVLPSGGMQKIGIVNAVAQSTDNLAAGSLPLAAGSGQIAVGGSTNDYKIVDSSPDFCVLRVLTNGTVQLIRTGGSKTYRVALWLVYW